MQVETLKIFCDVCETKNFTKAAKRNGLTQAGVSHIVMSLERKFHRQLVERGSGRRPLSLTANGQAFFECSREIVRLASEMEEKLQATKGARSGVVELAACHSIALHQLPSILQRFQQGNLATRVHVRYGSVDRVYEDVLEGGADLGLVNFPRWIPGLMREVFHKERLVLVCHPQHPLASCPAAIFKKLKGERFTAWKEIPWSMFLRTVGVYDRFHYQPVQELGEVEAVKQAVEADTGISILPEATVRSEVANQTLAAVPFKDDGFYEPLAVIYRKSKHCSPEMESFIQSLKRPDVMDGMDSGFEI